MGLLTSIAKTVNHLGDQCKAAHVSTLDEYLTVYGAELGKAAQEQLRPLHVPGRDQAIDFSWLKRQPFPAQAHAITAAAKALHRQKSILHVWEMGVGKSLGGMVSVAAAAISIGSVQQLSEGKRYRGIIFCPGQLVRKWERELRETIPGVKVIQLPTWREVVRIDRRTKPDCPTWYIISRDRCKLGAEWREVRSKNRKGATICPKCGAMAIDPKTKCAIPAATLAKKRHFCQGEIVKPDGTLVRDRDGQPAACGEPLWTFTHDLDRWEPARYIKNRMRGFFDYLIVDEIHQCKGGDDVEQANAIGALAAVCKKIIGLTGTLIGGMADHIRPLLFRIAPKTMVEEGFSWSDYMPFNERYGRIEIRTTEKESHSADKKHGRGKERSSNKRVRPGIMPSLFGRHLIDKAIFLSLDEIADNLPPLTEHVIGVDMDDEVGPAYKKIEDELTVACKEMAARGDKRLLGKMLNVLLGYPDRPHSFGEVGYYDGDSRWVTVTECPDLDAETIRPKEKALIELIKSEKAQGRQCWVYCQMTDKQDVMARLERLMQQSGLRVKVLRSSKVKLEQREEWIEKNGRSVDVVLSHPQLVETGLDLFDKRPGGHNFATLVFYQTGYNLFTLRQASRRAWRIGQQKECKVYYFFYNDTMQARAMSLMGKKMTAAAALEGKFSSEGLAAMAGEDSSVELAMARSLANKLDDLDAKRAWQKVASKPHASNWQPLPVSPQSEAKGPIKPDPVTVKPFTVPPRTRKPARKVAAGQLTFLFD